MSLNGAYVIEDANIVTSQGTEWRASLKVDDGRIAEIKTGEIKSTSRKIDAQGRYLLPGFIDLHCDAIEKSLEPRPNIFFPQNLVILEMDRLLAASGITTIFHSLSFAEGEIGVRSNRMAAQIISEIHRLAPNLHLRTKAHARFELTDTGALPYLEELLQSRKINLLSLMDHTPGQGQFKELTSFKNYFGTVYRKGEEELEQIIHQKFSAQKTLSATVDHVVSLCQSLAIPMASHDDDSPAKIKWLKERGITVSEFPVNLEAAATAKEHEIAVCLGAPNILRGNSQGNNLSGREAISSGCGDILCSDYLPMTLVHSVFTLYQLGLLPLHAAVNMVSLNPAKAVGLAEETGSIEPGKDADLILVDLTKEVPCLVKTWVKGKEVYSIW
ncbi:MAG: alpha-D-ribose 1-methylphosphonate 5-triphosphate diphosphatase [Thermodesulfobacteriota bacterium]